MSSINSRQKKTGQMTETTAKAVRLRVTAHDRETDSLTPANEERRGRRANKAKPDRLTSYNQVGSLESSRKSQLLTTVCVLLFLLGLVELSPWGLNLGGVTLGGLHMPFLSLASLLGIVLAYLLYRRRRVSCQFCGRRVESVVRPLVIKNELLARPGLVIDGTLYSLVGRLPKRRRWMKLHQMSRVCHQCRIYETRHFKRYEALSEQELRKLQSELDKQIFS